MRIDLARFKELYARIFAIDFTEAVPGICISLKSVAGIRAATSKGAPFLPLTYQDHFAAPLEARLPNVLSKLDQQVARGERPAEYRAMVLEALYGAIYQHGYRVTQVEARPQLKRFLAVVSNLYRSFIDADKRAAAGVKPVAELPPLALFQSVSDGPFTIESDLMKEKVGVSIGIVSLPAAYRDHPVLWTGLAHEVGGHDVVHADAGLIEEMAEKTRKLLAPVFKPGRNPDTATLNALIWSYWMDEAAADVYGVLNMGPSFAINLAAFLAAYRAKQRGQTEAGDPFISIDTAELPNGDMDLHPVDVLRFHIAAGAVEGLTGLSPARRRDYVASIEAVADRVAFGVTEIGLRGRVTIDRDKKIEINADMKLSDATAAARKVGKMLATGTFARLNNHCIQDVETWDDLDEDIAQEICGKVLAGESIVAAGDDAQLLAGVTLALLQKPELYDAATEQLNIALDDSFDRDPIWGATLRGHAMAAVSKRAAAAAESKGKAGKKSGKKPARKKR
ncbi:MAG TPA: hypothetical protein VJR30_24160 [Bradyrhizobium sp.]|nr:hypothetical protein [Bradyrhizobium sp.]